MKKITLTIALLMSFAFGSVHAAANYERGRVYDITSIPAGLLIRLDGNRMPTDCGASPHGWMIIPEENTTMISVALAMYAQGNTTAVVYISGSHAGFCRVTQFDPS